MSVQKAENVSDPNEIWHVEVHRNGEQILCIGHNSLSGKQPLSERELEVIRVAGRNLQGFAGSSKSGAGEATCGQ